MNEQQYNELVAKLGTDAKALIDKAMAEYKTAANKATDGLLSKEEFEAAQKSLNSAIEEVKEIARKQGTSLGEMIAKLDAGKVGTKTIQEQLRDDAEELKSIFRNRHGAKEYMVTVNEKGQFVMTPFDSIKAAGTHASVANVGGAGNVSSVSQSYDAASLLRMHTDSPIMSLYRNSPWLFPLCNLVNVGVDEKFFVWFEEQAKDGSSATVAEGGTKPAVQYKYDLKTATYKKEAMLVSFTDEFSMDFGRLADDIRAKATVDMLNRMNTAILANVNSAATVYNSAATYAPTGDKLTSANDWDVVAALAAQAENATYSNVANVAVVGTNKKYRMGTAKDTQGRYIDAPGILSGINIISNPEQPNTDLIVGDLKQYNIALRGGIIVRVGYNGTDFAENKFSTVIEQYYYDYIANIRKPAIVKGVFGTVKTALTT